MKLINTLLTTTALVLAVSSASANPFTGTYVGAKLGTSRAASQKKSTISSSTLAANAALQSGQSSKSTNWGVNGGLTIGHRFAVDSDVILGVSLGLDLESTKSKTSTNITPAAPNAARTTKFTTETKRKYIANLLGQVGYVAHKDWMPYLTAGLSVTQFKISAGTDNGYTVGGTTVGGSKNKTAFGYVVGAGTAYAINSTVSADLQYLYTGYANTKLKTTNIETGAAAGLVTAGTARAPRAYHAVTVGVSVKI
jgi:opacity protein-like surface antigen